MQIIHIEPRESEEAAEIVRGLGWLLVLLSYPPRSRIPNRLHITRSIS
jgi:hypothetical protein